MLSLRAEQDGHLRQKLQHVLKLSKEKWEEARDHAMRAVVPDNRMRAWYADRRNMDIGLLFTCRLGAVELERPVGKTGVIAMGCSWCVMCCCMCGLSITVRLLLLRGGTAIRDNNAVQHYCSARLQCWVVPL